MLRHRLVLLAFLSAFILILPMPVPQAVGAGGEKKEEEKEETLGSLFNAPREVDIPTMIVPVTDQSGRILSYAYLTLQVEVLGIDVWAVREKIPFLQDAFLRNMFAQSIGSTEQFGKVDVDQLKSRLKAEASAILQKGTVTQIIIKKLDVANV